MVSIHVDIEKLEWTPGSAKYGAVAVYDGKEIIPSKILSDRRQEGGGLAFVQGFTAAEEACQNRRGRAL
jgi:hypothetical protein